MDSIKKEFEIWADSRGLDLYCSRKDLYEDTETLWAWSAWKASRKAITIELPVIVDKDWACGEDECESMRHGITMTKHKINAAGIRTK